MNSAEQLVVVTVILVGAWGLVELAMRMAREAGESEITAGEVATAGLATAMIILGLVLILGTAP